MSVSEVTEKKGVEDDVIDVQLSDVIQFLKASRRRILLGALTGLAIGALYAFSKPNVYTAQITVMPEIQTKSAGLGSLGSLAGLAGIDISNSASGVDAIRPDIYPDVLRSVPFALHILNQPIYSEKLKSNMTLRQYMSRIDEEGIFRLINGSSDDGKKDKTEKLDPKNFSQAIQLTKEQEELVKAIQANVTSVYEKKTGILTIIATEQDPVVSAIMARLSLEYLTNYITTYRTEKARKQVTFLIQRVAEVKSRYQSAEYALSTYRDRNRNLFLNTAKIDEQRLQADYLLEQSVYNELSKQLEQAKIKVQEETPVFKVLEPATVPLRKNGPKRTFIMIGFTAIGMFITLIALSVRRFLQTYATSVV